MNAESPTSDEKLVAMLTTQGVEVMIPRMQVAHFKAKNYTVK